MYLPNRKEPGEMLGKKCYHFDLRKPWPKYMNKSNTHPIKLEKKSQEESRGRVPKKFPLKA